MARKSKRSYEAVTNFITEKYPRFKPAKAHCDYEGPLRDSLKEAFGCKIVGCWFHYSQAS